MHGTCSFCGQKITCEVKQEPSNSVEKYKELVETLEDLLYWYEDQMERFDWNSGDVDFPKEVLELEEKITKAKKELNA